jgi:hypothetical protein
MKLRLQKFVVMILTEKTYTKFNKIKILNSVKIFHFAQYYIVMRRVVQRFPANKLKISHQHI